MKFKINSASNWGNKEDIEIGTVEELMQIALDNEEAIVIHPPSEHRDYWLITIYDDYLE